jgi:hypothetical protein
MPEPLKCCYYSASSPVSHSSNHVEGYSLFNPRLASYPIDRLLHFPESSVFPFHSIGGRGKKLFIQEGEGLFDGWRKDFLQGRVDLLILEDTQAELGKLLYPSLQLASPIEQRVDGIHDFAESAQSRIATGHSGEGLFLLLGQFPLDQQETVFKEVRDLLFKSGLLPAGRNLTLTIRPSAFYLGNALPDFLSHLSQGSQNCLGNLFDHMEFAYLVRDSRKEKAQRLGIQGRPVRRDAFHHQASLVQDCAKLGQESLDVGMVGRVVQNLYQQPVKTPIIDNNQDAEGPIVDLVDSEISREVLQNLLKVKPPNEIDPFFFPTPRPSFGQFPGGPILDGLARDSSSPHRREARPRQRGGRPVRQPDGNTGSKGPQDLRYLERSNGRMSCSNAGSE